jgi:type IV pilus assembly protein PilN
MFTPEINFLKERPQDQAMTTVGPTDTSGPGGGGGSGVVVIGIGVVVAGLAFGAFFLGRSYLGNQLASLQQRRDQLNTELQTEQTELTRLQTLEAELNQIRARTEAFRAFFSDIQPWSALLQDLRNRVPVDVWISNMVTVDNQVTIQGQSLTFDQVNDFLLTLQQSPYVEDVRLASSERIDATEQTLASVRYSMTVTLADLNLASPELAQALADDGAEGLLEKVNILRDLVETN